MTLARRNPSTMNAAELERWSCSPYASSIAYQIRQVLPGVDARVIRRVAEGEGRILTRVRILLWLATLRPCWPRHWRWEHLPRHRSSSGAREIGLMKAIGAGSGTIGFLLAAEQLLLAFVGGGVGYALGILLGAHAGAKEFLAWLRSLPFWFSSWFSGWRALVTLLGSAIPLRRASRYEPAPILRGE